MNARIVRSRFLTACLMALVLLSTGVARAQSLTKPGDDPSGALTAGDPPSLVRDHAGPSAWISPMAPTSSDDTTLWLGKSFVSFSSERTCPLAPTSAASTERSSSEPIALPKVEVPGTVRNLRRTDG